MALVAEESAQNSGSELRISRPELPDRVDCKPSTSRVAGFIVAQYLGVEWEIENVAVLPAARRRGIGQRLIAELLTLAANEGAEAVYLEVRASNVAARSLYEGLGFKETGRRRDYYSVPAEDAILYGFSIQRC
jgi:ribosomal-protein-alanine N-acetyltransferase